MPEAGWYQDPHNPNQQRYWDGTTWTEHTHDAPFHPPSGPGQGPGPAEVFGAPGSQVPGHINDIGNWLSRSFSVLFSNAMPLFLLLLLAIVPSMAPYWGLHQMVKDAVLTFDGFDDRSFPTGVSVEGISTGGVTVTAVVMLLATLVAAALTLAQSYVLYRGHVGRPASLGQALSAGARGLPRYVGWWLAVFLAVVLLAIVVSILIGVLGFVSPALAALASFLMLLVAIPFGVWLWTKTTFLSVSCAVAPRGQSALRASTERSTSRFWGVFGRILLLAIITIFVSGIVQSFASTSFLGAVGLNVDGVLTVDDEPITELEEGVRLGDLIPFDSGTVVAMVIGGILAGAVGLYSRSGLAGLYADLDGPSEVTGAEALDGAAAS
jgi:hypothetical protein